MKFNLKNALIVSKAKRKMKYLKCNTCKNYRRLFNKKNLKECNCPEEVYQCDYYPFEWYYYCRMNSIDPITEANLK